MRPDSRPCRGHRHPKLKAPVPREQVRRELAELYHRAGFRGRLDLDWPRGLGRTHDRNWRRYAQVAPLETPPHFELAPQACYLPARNRRALLAHEVGHALDPHGNEDDADDAAYEALGVRVGYDRRWPGKGLQVARNPSEYERVREAYRRWAERGDLEDFERWMQARGRVGLPVVPLDPAHWEAVADDAHPKVPRWKAVHQARPSHKRKRMRVIEAEDVIRAWLRGLGWRPDARATGRHEVWVREDEQRRAVFKRAHVVFERGGRGRWVRDYKMHRWGDPLGTIDFANRLIENTAIRLARFASFDDPYALNPAEERFLPARIQAHAVPPRRHSFELMARGEAPLVYVPPGARGTSSLPAVTRALGSLLSSHPLEGGLADPNAWEDLLAAVGHTTSGKLYAVDRNGERWRVLRVSWDPGGQTGEVELQHQGRFSRGGRTHWVDLQRFYGQMIPLVVYR